MMMCIILAGGKGKRLGFLTNRKPKPLLRLNNICVSEFIIRNLKKAGIKDIILSTGYLKNRFREHYVDGSRLGIKVRYVEEDQAMGTGGAIKLSEKHLKKTFMVHNGDIFTKIDYKDMIKRHKKNKALATIALIRVEDPNRFGVAALKGEQIVNFIEKPEKGKEPSNLINAGIYILEPKVLKMIPKNKFVSLEKEIFPKIVKLGKMYGYRLKHFWFDIGTIKSYKGAKEFSEKHKIC
jgi:NDP-sugar pyrophosphorylase family protein